MKKYLISVKKMLKIINESQNIEDIDNCKILIENYIKAAKQNNVVNIEDLNKRLYDELSQRYEAIYLSNILNK